MEFKKKDLLIVEDKTEEGVIQKVLSKLKGIRDRAKSEVEETRALVRVLTHAVRSYAKTREFDLDEKDKEFIKGQSSDVIKNIILMIVAIIPLPIPLTPFLVLFGKKVGVDFIPKQQDIPEKGKKKEKLDEVRVKKKKHIQQTSDEVKRAVKLCVDLSMDDVKKFLKREDVQIDIVSIKTITYGKSKLLNQEVTLDLKDSEGKDIKLSRSKFIDLSDVFYDTLSSMGFNDIQGEYYHFFFEEQDDENITESLYEKMKSKLNIIITESQYDYILEATKKYKNIIHKLCANQKDNGPYCRLYDLYNRLEKENEDLSVDLVVAIEELNDFFKYKNIGALPAIVELALQDQGRTVSYLDLLVEFLYDKTQDDTTVKKVLKKQKTTKVAPKDLEELLATARYLEHDKYEKRFEGRHFEKYRTSLKLDYKCTDDAKERLFELLLQVNNKEKAINVVSNDIISCVQKSMTQGTYYIKADLKQTTDLTVSGVTVFPAGSLFEVKKMDPFIDSYLSEFFSIFKETDVIKYKGEIGLMYNELIQIIYEWLEGDGKKISDDYLNKVKTQMAGVIYENDTIVPIQYIDLYWSNRGQRSCEEKRLSIRFRIDPEVSEITAYKFVDEDELVPVKITIPSNEKQKVLCP